MCSSDLLECADSFAALPELPARVRARLEAETVLPVPPVAAETDSSDGFTRKYLLGLADGHRIETVLMRFTGRVTACISSQVGCAMGCVFCATGQMGYTRHLTPGEIVAQAVHVARTLRRLPDDKPQGYFNVWPPIVRTTWEIMAMERQPMKVWATPQSIDRMDECFAWLFWLEPEEARVVYDKARDAAHATSGSVRARPRSAAPPDPSGQRHDSPVRCRLPAREKPG